jgi:beta-lactamase class A
MACWPVGKWTEWTRWTEWTWHQRGDRRVKKEVKKGIQGFNIDRDERELDAEEAGLRWDPKYTNEKLLDQAISALPDSTRESGFYASQHHNTATPIAVANLLRWLAEGWLLSPRSSAFLLETMAKTRTFPDRLKAGVPKGWLLAHKTGTSSTWKGVTGATNDVGILIAPNAGSFVIAAVFISNSRRSDQDRAALIANVARAAGSCCQ